MSLKKSAGNMYPWVTHTHSHLGGKCPHECSYCYVSAMAAKFDTMRQRYGGVVRLIEDEFKVNYGKGKTIFIEHMNDLFADGISNETIHRVLNHCFEYPENHYVFQTKNPKRYFYFITQMPRESILGTTIETNRYIPEVMGKSPTPFARFEAMRQLRRDIGFVKLFVTVEPILAFDVNKLADWIAEINPNFLNIGADSKKRGLPEPSKESVLAFIEALRARHIEIRQKHNLERLLK
jgi:DNA repair photolyase